MNKRKDESALPPPVSIRSSKSALWEELQCVRREVDSQQFEVIQARETIKRDRNEIELLRYQIKLIRQVLDLEIR